MREEYLPDYKINNFILGDMTSKQLKLVLIWKHIFNK